MPLSELTVKALQLCMPYIMLNIGHCAQKQVQHKPFVNIVPLDADTLFLKPCYIRGTQTKGYWREKTTESLHPVSHVLFILIYHSIGEVQAKIEYRPATSG